MMMGKKEQAEPFKSFATEEEWQEAMSSELLERIKALKQQKEQESGIQSIKNEMLKAEAKIKERVPEFDLATMLKEDPEFRERILKGYSVEDAFYLSNVKKAEETPKKKIGIMENGRNRYIPGASPAHLCPSLNNPQGQSWSLDWGPPAWAGQAGPSPPVYQLLSPRLGP